MLKAGKVDLDYLIRYTNAPFLVNQDEASNEHGLFIRDEDGKALIWDRVANTAVPFDTPGAKPAMKGDFTAPNGAPGGSDVNHPPKRPETTDDATPLS